MKRNKYILFNTDTNIYLLREQFDTYNSAQAYADKFNKYFSYEKYIVVPL